MQDKKQLATQSLQKNLFQKCHECLNKPATVKCSDCKIQTNHLKFKFCYICDSQIHKDKKNLLHKKEIIPYSEMMKNQFDFLSDLKLNLEYQLSSSSSLNKKGSSQIIRNSSSNNQLLQKSLTHRDTTALQQQKQDENPGVKSKQNSIAGQIKIAPEPKPLNSTLHSPDLKLTESNDSRHTKSQLDFTIANYQNTTSTKNQNNCKQQQKNPDLSSKLYYLQQKLKIATNNLQPNQNINAKSQNTSTKLLNSKQYINISQNLKQKLIKLNSPTLKLNQKELFELTPLTLKKNGTMNLNHDDSTKFNKTPIKDFDLIQKIEILQNQLEQEKKELENKIQIHETQVNQMRIVHQKQLDILTIQFLTEQEALKKQIQELQQQVQQNQQEKEKLQLLVSEFEIKYTEYQELQNENLKEIRQEYEQTLQKKISSSSKDIIQINHKISEDRLETGLSDSNNLNYNDVAVTLDQFIFNSLDNNDEISGQTISVQKLIEILRNKIINIKEITELNKMKDKQIKKLQEQIDLQNQLQQNEFNKDPKNCFDNEKQLIQDFQDVSEKQVNISDCNLELDIQQPDYQEPTKVEISGEIKEQK